MSSPKNYVIGLLAVTTIGGAVLAWQQYAELVELRVSAMNRTERADLQQRIADLERLNRELQDQLAAQRRANGVDDLDGLIAEAREERPAGGERGRGDRGRGPGPGRGDARGAQQASAIRELLSRPEVQAMMSLQQKAAIEARYAALFKNLNLAPAQVEKLKTLLAERTTTLQDISAAAREQGINPRESPDAYRKLITDAQNEINANIKSTIGDAGFAQLQTYEQTLPQRSLVNDLQQRLSYTDTPLTATQAEQLVQILAANAPARTAPGTPGASGATDTPPANIVIRGPGLGPPSGGGPGPGPGGGMVFLSGPGSFVPGMGPSIGMDVMRGGATITPGAVAQAQTVLTPPQLNALQQIQKQQQTQQQLQQLMRDTLSANQPQPTTGSAGSAKGASGSSGGTGAPPMRKRPGGG